MKEPRRFYAIWTTDFWNLRQLEPSLPRFSWNWVDTSVFFPKVFIYKVACSLPSLRDARAAHPLSAFERGKAKQALTLKLQWTNWWYFQKPHNPRQSSGRLQTLRLPSSKALANILQLSRGDSRDEKETKTTARPFYFYPWTVWDQSSSSSPQSCWKHYPFSKNDWCEVNHLDVCGHKRPRWVEVPLQHCIPNHVWRTSRSSSGFNFTIRHPN